jgi:small subunit ribosomal protein S16
MLAIRMQRTGRKGHAMFRMVVQDTRQTPTSGKVVAQLGHYDPHTKDISVDTEKATFYLTNGAQPSDRVARLLQKQGVELPEWVQLSGNKSKAIRNPEKLRKNQPKEEAAEEVVEEVTEEAAEAPVAEVAEAPVDTPAETPDEAPAVEAADDTTEAATDEAEAPKE